VWAEEDAAAYDKQWPIGTKERVWRDVLFYTGLRRGDAVKLGRQHVRNGIATLRTEKSQGEITVCIPILPILRQTLDAGPTGELAFICGKNGKPLTKESFGNAFKDACKAAGLHNRSAHGCRKIAGHSRRRSRRNSRRTERDIWLARHRDGIALHRKRRPKTSRA
jgi:integrase